MKGLGNYSTANKPTEERRVGKLVMYRADRAMIEFPGALSYGITAVPFRAAGIAEGEHFVLIVHRLRGAIIDVPRVEKHAAARPPIDRKATPKVLVRDGRKLSTRRDGR